ncbi:MAG: radical SAM protein [Thermoplasmata archaeon]|nr:radical SAM protein [Thermoplasmata archaeon]
MNVNELPKIAGILISGIDHPSHISLNIYLPFCNFNCRNCHNYKIAKGIFEEMPYENLFWEFENNFIVDMVIITGGEPTLQGDKLINLIKLIKNKRPELIIRVDSNGSLPGIIKKLSLFVDGFAIDIKAPPFNKDKYEYTIRKKFDTESLIESVKIASELPYTIFRTVKYPWLKENDIEEIKMFLNMYGKGKPYFVNPFFNINDNDQINNVEEIPL